MPDISRRSCPCRRRRPLRWPQLVPSALSARQDQARARRGPDRRRRAELLHARRQPRRQGRRRDRPAHQQDRQGLPERGADPGLAHAGPHLLCLLASRQEAVRDASSCPTATRSCGPTTACRAPTAPRSTRASTSRMPSSSSARATTPRSTATRPSSRPTASSRPGSTATSRGAASRRCSSPGLATDFCVAWSAMDARKLGLDAYVIEDACRGIDTQGSLAAAWKDMDKAGVKRIQSGELA